MTRLTSPRPITNRARRPAGLLFASEMLLKSNHGGTWRRADYTEWLTRAMACLASAQHPPARKPAPLPENRSATTS
ncbi:hypothetical protein DN069_09405 [Streptacidiphilus pinicola]|uniref:Uncharacterized protein n=1 Tax=Streptacidiphilus pinicola TaxID=2219663 RepID=A0A2X0IR92_9ACTN|nr:hypothetical protein DN069_09405 [Streptacidiphilus pinicola]